MNVESAPEVSERGEQRGTIALQVCGGAGVFGRVFDDGRGGGIPDS